MEPPTTTVPTEIRKRIPYVLQTRVSSRTTVPPELRTLVEFGDMRFYCVSRSPRLQSMYAEYVSTRNPVHTTELKALLARPV